MNRFRKHAEIHVYSVHKVRKTHVKEELFYFMDLQYVNEGFVEAYKCVTDK